jgi:hypothetical protein
MYSKEFRDFVSLIPEAIVKGVEDGFKDFSGAVNEFLSAFDHPYTERTLDDLVREERRQRRIQNKQNLKKMVTGKRKVREWD